MTPCKGCAASADCQPIGREFIQAGIFFKEMDISKAGTLVPQHSHGYAHTSYVVKGSVLITWGKNSRIVTAPEPVLIPAGIKHTFMSLENDTLVLCVHDISRTGSVEILEEHNIMLEDN